MKISYVILFTTFILCSKQVFASPVNYFDMNFSDQGSSFRNLEDSNSLIDVNQLSLTGWFSINQEISDNDIRESNGKFLNSLLNIEFEFGGLNFNADSILSSEIRLASAGGYFTIATIDFIFKPMDVFNSINVHLGMETNPVDSNSFEHTLITNFPSEFSISGEGDGVSFKYSDYRMMSIAPKSVVVSEAGVPLWVWLFVGIIAFVKNTTKFTAFLFSNRNRRNS